MHISWRQRANMDASERTPADFFDSDLPNTTSSNSSNINNNVQAGIAQGNNNEVIPSEIPTDAEVGVPLDCWPCGSQTESYTTSGDASRCGVDGVIRPGAARGKRSRAGSPNLGVMQGAADGSADIPVFARTPDAEQALEGLGIHDRAPSMEYGEELGQRVFPAEGSGVVTPGWRTASAAAMEEVRLLTVQTPPVRREQKQGQQSPSGMDGIPIVPLETRDVSLEFEGECAVPPSSHEAANIPKLEIKGADGELDTRKLRSALGGAICSWEEPIASEDTVEGIDRMFWSPTFGRDVDDSPSFPFDDATNTDEVKGIPENDTGREQWTTPRRSAPKRLHLSSVRGMSVPQVQSARKQQRRGPHPYRRSPMISDEVKSCEPSGRAETCTPDLAKLRLDSSLSDADQSLHADNKGLPLADVGPEACPPSRGQSCEPSIWSLDVMRRITDTLQPLPPPPPLQQQRLRRDQSFPPLDVNSGGSRPLSDDSFFPPPSSDVSLLGTTSPQLSSTAPPGSASMSLTGISSTHAAVATLGTEDSSRGRGGGSNARVVKHGSPVGDPAYDVADSLRCFGGDSMHGSQSDEKLTLGYTVDRMDGGLVDEHRTDRGSPAADGEGGSDNGSNGMLSPSVKSETEPRTHLREGSFDELAAMIPGLPPDLQPTPASRALQHRSNRKASAPFGRGRWTASPASLLPMLDSATTLTPEKAGRGRSSTRGKPTARGLAIFNPRPTGASGDGDGRGDGYIPGDTAGPTTTDKASEGSMDLMKKARRNQAIERYLYKMGRRAVADRTREESPSRSRPKAAKLRKRVRGRFVKVVPDFISATADSSSHDSSTECDSSGVAGSVPAPAPAAVVQAHD